MSHNQKLAFQNPVPSASRTAELESKPLGTFSSQTPEQMTGPLTQYLLLS